MMKYTLCFGSYSLLFAFLFFFIVSHSLRLPHHPTKIHGEVSGSKNQVPMHFKESGAEEGTGMELYRTGSSLPDCSHACGACTPCKRVMVTFKCSVAESCPVVYRCMCKGKYYHVPSL